VRIVCSRSSTAPQPLLRQRHILTVAGLLVRTEGVAEGFHPAEGVLLFADPATTSKIRTGTAPVREGRLRRAPGDTLTVSDVSRVAVRTALADLRIPPPQS
jgi:hypothetical protein